MKIIDKSQSYLFSFVKVSSASSVGLPGTANPGASTDPSKMSNSSIMALFSSVPQNKGINEIGMLIQRTIKNYINFLLYVF